jgi:flagellar biosynthetic protein FliR
MPLFLMEILLALPAFAMVLCRIGGLVMTAPVYGSPVVPVRIKAGIVIGLAVLIFPLIRHQAPSEISWSTAILGLVGELVIGSTIGLTLTVLISGAEVAGLTIGQQAGLALGEVFNPTYNDQTSVLGQIYGIVFVLLFLIAGGHRETLASLLDTYSVMPIGSASFRESYVLLVLETLTSAFVVGIRLAGPVLIALLLTSVLLGVLSRTMPQLHILTVGFTLKIMVALAVAAAAITGSREIIVDAVLDTISDVREVFDLSERLWE